ncbi:MafB [Streptococcus respiraculi]|uniref:MafB n=1 Tax=Streptococcus respiraculi TaxID=2021971 RepID=UPI000E740E3D|nr:MafB [Streptococcus respiraculi]
MRKLKGNRGVGILSQTLDKFVELKYNDSEGYKELKDRVHWGNATFPTEKSFDGPFNTHAKEFGNISKTQYQQLAASLLAEPTSETIVGYETDKGRRVRYDRKNNIIVIGNRTVGGKFRINTMLRPEEGESYYNENYDRDHHG